MSSSQMLGILVIGLVVPSNDKLLLQSMVDIDSAFLVAEVYMIETGHIAQSPFVIAISRAGIKTLPSVLNAGIFTSAFSAGDTFLFCSSRILYGLALRGQAPRFLTYCTDNGIPLYAVLTSVSTIFCGLIYFFDGGRTYTKQSLCALLSFMTLSSDSNRVFNWFVNLTTIGGFLSWWTINLTFIFFCEKQHFVPITNDRVTHLQSDRGAKAQGIDRTNLIYHNTLQPYLAYWGIFWTTFFTLVNGYAVFFHFNTADFLTCCTLPDRVTLGQSDLLFQISTFQFSSHCIYSGNSSRKLKSGSPKKWTSTR
jgi:yeast amino acid transporter